MKKLILKISLLLSLILALSACQMINKTTQNTSTTIEQQEVQPIVLDVYLSNNGKFFDREIEAYINPESVESLFDYYGLYDKNSKTYRLIMNGKQYDFQYNNNMLSADGIKIKAQLDDDLLLDSQEFFDFLGQNKAITRESNQVLRLSIADNASLPKALLTGTAHTDYTRTVSKEFREKEVDVVNAAEGFALIIDEKQPYLTSEANLTYLEQTEKTKENSSESNARKPVFLWDLYANDDKLKLNSRVDVVLPKWLSLKDETGNISMLYGESYVNNIKTQGGEIWALVNNSFDPELTGKVLNSVNARDNFNRQLINYCLEHSIRGINLDFENMNVSDSDAFVQLVAELKLLSEQNNIQLSACVTVPDGSDNWSKCYDRKRMIKNLDLMMLMAYDQYYAGSPVAGPVAGYNWVEENIGKMLELVPAEKLVLGVPFYTRLWYESIDEKVPNHSKVKSKSIFMPAALNIITSKNPTRVWDEENKQNYYAYYEDNHLVKFWYEGPVSVSLKTDLANRYNLAGVAYWALGFETEETWQKITEKIGK